MYAEKRKWLSPKRKSFFFVIYIYGVKFSLFNWHQAVGEKAMCSYIFNWQMVCLLFTPLLSSSWSSSCIVSDYRPQKSINRITYRIFQVQESDRWRSPRSWRPPPTDRSKYSWTSKQVTRSSIISTRKCLVTTSVNW